MEEGGDDGAGIVVPAIRVDFGISANWRVYSISAHLEGKLGGVDFNETRNTHQKSSSQYAAVGQLDHWPPSTWNVVAGNILNLGAV